MEAVRYVKKIKLIVLVMLIATVSLAVYKINNDEEGAVLNYYRKYTDIYTDALEQDSEEVAYAAVFSVRLEQDDTRLEKNQARGLLKNKISYVNNYEKTLSDTSAAQKILNSSLYESETSYGKMSVLKYLEDSQKLEGVQVQIGNTVALEKFMGYTELSVLFVVMLIMAITVFIEERDNRVIYLVHASSGGRGILGLKRCAILGASVLVLSYIFNILIYAVYLCVYGGWNYLDIPVQSCENFRMFPLQLNIWQFFMLYCLIFAAAMYAFGLIAYLFVSSMKNYKFAITIILGICIVEYLLYNGIDEKSSLCVLHYVNIINVIIPQNSYCIYENWGYNGFVSDVSETTAVLTLFVGVIGFIGALCTAKYCYPGKKTGAIDRLYLKLSSFWQGIFSKAGLGLMEFYKTYALQKGIIVLLIAVYLFQSCQIQKGVQYDDNKNNYLIEFYDKFGGQYPDTAVYEYKAELESKVELLNSKDKQTYSETQSVKLMKAAADTIEDTILHLEKMKTERGIDGVIVKPDTYNDIFGERLYNNQESINLICILAVILMIAGDFSFERRCGMYVILRSTEGRNRVWYGKLVKTVISAVLVWGISAGMNLHNILQYYVFNNVAAPVQSLVQFADFLPEISISGYMIMCQLIRLLILMLVAMLILGISFFADYKKALTVSLSLIIPHILYILGVPFVEYFSVVKLMDYNAYGTIFANKAAMCIMPAIMLMAVIALYMVIIKKWKNVVKC